MNNFIAMTSYKPPVSDPGPAIPPLAQTGARRQIIVHAKGG